MREYGDHVDTTQAKAPRFNWRVLTILVGCGIILVLCIAASALSKMVLVLDRVPRGGRQIAYLKREDQDTRSVYILDMGSKQPRQITRGGQVTWLEWLPDGETLVLTRRERAADPGKVTLLEVSTGRLTDPDVQPPRWSPDGRKRIVVEKDNALVYDPSTRSSSTLMPTRTLNLWFSSSPSLSPDQQTIAFASRRDSDADSEIYLMNIDGTNIRKLVTRTGADINAIWSPNGQRLIVVGAIYDGTWGGLKQREFFVVNKDGQNLVPLGSDYTYALPPSWSPDGQKILFYEGVAKLCVADADGSNKQCMKYGESVYAAWSPDSKEIAYIPGDLISYKPKICVTAPDTLDRLAACIDTPGVAAFGWRP